MKKYFFFLFVSLPLLSAAQQNLPVKFHKYKKQLVFDSVGYNKAISIYKITSDKETAVIPPELAKFLKGEYTKEKEVKNDIHHFTLYGIGNISDETLKSLNAGGKLAVGFTPKPSGSSQKYYANYFASFNKNASNTDSALSTMLVFPEAGNHSFMLSVIWLKSNDGGDESGLKYFNGPFLEFAFKKITNKKDTTDPKFQELSINTLHYTGGWRFGYAKEKTIEDKKYQTGVYLTIFGSFVNIPDEDHVNFQAITKQQFSKNSFFLLGAKVAFELNGFQIFADVRHVFGKEKDLPIKDLQGFNSNIGVAFNTEIFRF